LAVLSSYLGYGEQIAMYINFSGINEMTVMNIGYYNGVKNVWYENSGTSDFGGGSSYQSFANLIIRREAPVVAAPVPTPVPTPVPAPVPTPASALLLVSALGGAGVWVRRRRGARAPQA